MLIPFILLTLGLVKISSADEEDDDGGQEITAKWVFKSSKSYFINTDRSKQWREYRSDKLENQYRLFMYNESNVVILENLVNNRSQVLLSANQVRYLERNSLRRRSDGFWDIEPVFPDFRKMKEKIKWIYENDQKSFYQKSGTSPLKWDEFESGRKKSSWDFRTFDGESVILENKSKRQFVQIFDDRVLFGLGDIESLDFPGFELTGGWESVLKSDLVNFFQTKTSKWTEFMNETHFFLNANGTKLWNEFFSKKIVNNYRLYGYDGNQLILENLKNTLFVKLSQPRTVYVDGPIQGSSSPLRFIYGRWDQEPNFPDDDVMFLKAIWVYSNNPNRSFKRRPTLEWVEFENENECRQKATYNFRTYDGESVILLRKNQAGSPIEFIQLTNNQVLFGGNTIESLDRPIRSVQGKWIAWSPEGNQNRLDRCF